MNRIFPGALLNVAMLLGSPAAADETWYDRSPKLAVMTGYIYEPLKPYTIDQWLKGLGGEMDADRWVADFKQAGASYVIFYDKWIDGLVFHDTKTTGFKTERDLLRPLADACHQGELPLVLYFNAMTDGNPEFDKWSLIGRSGRPLVFSPRWPTRVQTLCSPFRKVSIAQVRELMTGYGRIDGVWLDIFRDRGLESTSEFVPTAFEKTFGKPLGEASPAERQEFPRRLLADYLDDVRAIAQQHQPDCVWTANGSAAWDLAGGPQAKWVCRRLDYGSVEGHQIGRIERLALPARARTMPTEIGLLLNSSWFTPLEDEPPPPKMTREAAMAATAMGVCQGASIYFALTPGHSGNFGGDLKLAKQVGAWFKTVEPALENAEAYADVGIVLGSPGSDGSGLAASGGRSVVDDALAVQESLLRAGVFGSLLLDPARRERPASRSEGPPTDGRAESQLPEGRRAPSRQPCGSWPESLSGFRAVVVPQRAPLDDKHVDQLREYVEQGGRLIAFGRASLLDENGQPREDAVLGDVLGARYRGETIASPGRRKSTVKTDSDYSQEFAAAHLVDGKPTAWASGDTPMPHWAEIVLTEKADVAKVELVSRAGPYLVTDVDIEIHDGSAWKKVQSIRGAAARTIVAKFDRPISTSRIRITILRELYEGKERQYADVESIRVLDKDGRDCSTNAVATPLPVTVSKDAAETFGDAALSFPSTVADFELLPRAEVLARLGNKDATPVIVRHRFGHGETILVAASEASLAGNHAFWTGLRRLAVGQPTMRCEAAAYDRYRFVLTRVADAHVLHAIDRTAGSATYKPADVHVALDTERLGRASAVRHVADDRPVETNQEGRFATFVLRPHPVATVRVE